ncbi:MAG: ABC transporter substrate-binding protein [Devosia sp.]|nr:ABC transporter substrate-binding protein [Devosia sp.]
MFGKSFTCAIALLCSATALTVPATLPARADDAAAPLACKAFSEAPELHELVAAGKLPPVEQRLPEEPGVVQPADKIGVYGGTFEDTTAGGGAPDDTRHFGYEPLVRWSADGSKVIPGIAKSWDVSPDGKSYTFHLRKGMKWSDGQPFTSADIVFWWDRVENNKKIMTSGPRNIFVVNGEAAKVAASDAETVTFSWSQPNGLFLLNMATPYGQRTVQFAEHYMKHFDLEEDPDNVKKLMAATNETDYTKWWHDHVGTYGDASQYADPNRPSIQPWIATASFLGTDRYVFVRNPYYFAVDPSCQQLPYIDNHAWTHVGDPQVNLLNAIQGKVSMSTRDISIPQNKSVFFDNQKKGDYHLVDAKSCDYNTTVLAFSVNDVDPIKAKVFADKDFRIGVSEAINRQDIIDTVYLGQGKAFQPAPRPESPLYNDKWATEYTKFDLADANAHLDKILPRNADGVRVGPDGKPFTFHVLIDTEFRPDTGDAFQLIAKTWKQAGLNAQLDLVSDDTWNNRDTDPKNDAAIWVGENGCGQLPLLNLDRWLNDYSGWSLGNWTGWAAWDKLRLDPKAKLADGVTPVTPPEGVQRMYQIRSEIPTAVGDKQAALMKEFGDLAADNFLEIGIALPEGFYRAVHNDLHNVPTPLIEGWYYPGPAPSNFAQYYIQK